ncbi:hypothetical protein [Actinomadura fibrosa]|uniref:PASTA domain-containing protein n=1 Tax=Actinomadura fibrosa TaxID=111802 RepID=A0ABW2XRP2_9ACTN
MAAGRVAELVAEVAESLVGIAALNKAPGEVGPQPCEGAEVTQTIADSAGEGASSEEPWFVDYSPYTMVYIGYAQVPEGVPLGSLVVRMGERLAARGWRPREAAGTEESPELMIEAPRAGYGARIVGITAEPGPRLGIYIASPCFRCPD